MKPSITRIFAGLGILVLGALLLLDQLDIGNFNNVLGTWWPLFVIGAGVLILVSNARNWLWAAIVIGFGGLSLLRTLDVTDTNPWQLFWPAVIIAVGLSILMRGTSNPARAANEKGDDDVVAILGGVDQLNTSKDYKGGRATAILGGVKIDLRKATIKSEATLDIFALMGGIELVVPENVIVKSKASCIMGGIENKIRPDTKDPAILYLTGDIIMGGVDIKN